MEIIAEPKQAADVDFIDLEVPTKWLGQSVLNSVVLDVPTSSGLVFAGPEINGNTARFLVSGGNLGTHRIGVTVNAGTRKRTASLIMTVQG